MFNRCKKSKNFHAKTSRERDKGSAKKSLQKIKLILAWSLEDFAGSLACGTAWRGGRQGRLCIFASLREAFLFVSGSSALE